MDEPPLDPNNDFFMESFWRLGTERHYEHGAIPASAVEDYCIRRGLADDIIDPFVAVIRAMDNAFIDWSADQVERERNQKLGKTKTKAR